VTTAAEQKLKTHNCGPTTTNRRDTQGARPAAKGKPRYSQGGLPSKGPTPKTQHTNNRGDHEHGLWSAKAREKPRTARKNPQRPHPSSCGTSRKPRPPPADHQQPKAQEGPRAERVVRRAKHLDRHTGTSPRVMWPQVRRPAPTRPPAHDTRLAGVHTGGGPVSVTCLPPGVSRRPPQRVPDRPAGPPLTTRRDPPPKRWTRLPHTPWRGARGPRHAQQPPPNRRANGGGVWGGCGADRPTRRAPASRLWAALGGCGRGATRCSRVCFRVWALPGGGRWERTCEAAAFQGQQRWAWPRATFVWGLDIGLLAYLVDR